MSERIGQNVIDSFDCLQLGISLFGFRAGCGRIGRREFLHLPVIILERIDQHGRNDLFFLGEA